MGFLKKLFGFYEKRDFVVAARDGDIELVKRLFPKFGNQDSLDPPGQMKDSALTAAAWHGHLQIVQFLAETIEYERPINDALIHASEYGDLEIVKYLIEGKKADINTGSWIWEKTPLMAAAEKGHLKIVKYLIELGANKYQKDDNGSRAIDYASKNGHQDVVSYLKSLIQKDIEIRKRELVNKFGSTHGLMIFDGQIWVGMTEEQLLFSRGEPTNIADGSQRKIYKYGKNYGPRGGITYDMEIIIKNGVVKSWKENE